MGKPKKSITRRTALKAGVVATTAVTVAGHVATNKFKTVLDGRFGRGEMTVTTAEGAEGWDTEYCKKDTGSISEAKAASDAVSEEMTDEGIVLLKNDGVLPLSSGSTVTPFGWAYLNPSYSGNGAAASQDTTMVTPEVALSTLFAVNNAAVDLMNASSASYPDAAAGTDPLDFDTNSFQAVNDKGESAKIYEYDPSIYGSLSGVDGSCGIVFIKRVGSEGFDKRYEAYDDGTPHYLALSQMEKDTIRLAREKCGAVVLVLNTANPVELPPVMSGEYEANAIIWIGTTGSRGFESMAKILAGEVNPSGRLTDTYPSDFTADPTFFNFGSFEYTNYQTSDYVMIPTMNVGTYNAHYVEYREGVYLGYRYYETAAVEDPSFVFGTLDERGAITRPGAVAYPFGWGLSYTSFKQKIVSFDDPGDSLKLTVRVDNTGSMAGKDVVQIYFTAPYTDYDRENGVERPVTQLLDFAKTETIEPGESVEVNFEIDKEELAAYSYRHENSDGTRGCYVLEAGVYTIEVKANSHDVIDSADTEISGTTFFEPGNPRHSEQDAQSLLNDDGTSQGVSYDGSPFVAATNRFESLNDYMSSNGVVQLSRSDWKGTLPTELPRSKEASQGVLDELSWYDYFDYRTDEKLGNVPGSLVYSEEEPVSGANNGLSLIDLRGVDYHDARWDALLDQIDWDGDKESIQKLLYEAAYQTGLMESLGKPATTDADGAMGWSSEGASSWASTNLLAATWNRDLFHQMGVCIGEEGLQLGNTGWYAPSTNIHRSPFAGRVYEAYSEDPRLAGKVAASVISGAADKGLISYFKHFSMNNQETFRNYSLCTWANEQAFREIYLKPFEIAIKEGKSKLAYISDGEGTVSTKIARAVNALMSSYNFIGGVASFASYGLLHDVVRSEWGFTGPVITDLQLNAEPWQRDICTRTGNDLFMCSGCYANDYDSPTARTLMRESLHRVLFATANSNVMNGLVSGSVVSYSPSPWQYTLYAATAALLAIDAACIAGLVRGRKDKKGVEIDTPETGDASEASND